MDFNGYYVVCSQCVLETLESAFETGFVQMIELCKGHNASTCLRLHKVRSIVVHNYTEFLIIIQSLKRCNVSVPADGK